MELTPENITDQIKQLLPTNAHFEDQDGSLVLGNPILWLKAKIREYGEQQRLKAREDGFNSGYQKGLKDGQGY